MSRRSVALLIETSIGYNCGLREGVIPDVKHTGYQAASLLDQMMNGEAITTEEPLITQPLGIRLRESTDTVAIEDDQIAKTLNFIRRRASANIRVADVLDVVDLSRL